MGDITLTGGPRDGRQFTIHGDPDYLNAARVVSIASTPVMAPVSRVRRVVNFVARRHPKPVSWITNDAVVVDVYDARTGEYLRTEQ